MVGRRMGGAVAALVLALGLGACGDDDEGDGAADAGVDAGGDTGGDAPEPAEIVMQDYSYVVRGEAPVGGALRFTNDGEEVHMVAMGRFRDGMTIADVQEALSSDDEAAIESVLIEEPGTPGGLLPPGRSVDVSVVDLTPGEYALICFLPAVGSGAPHFAEGMVSSLTVTDEEVEPPVADVELTMTPGEAIEGPAELDAGRHTFGVTVEGDAADLEPFILRVPDGEDAEAVFNALDEEVEAAFSSESGPPAEFAATLAESLVIAAHDLGPATSFRLGADLEPGNYVLVMIDTDPEGPKDLTTRYEFTVT